MTVRCGDFDPGSGAGTRGQGFRQAVVWSYALNVGKQLITSLLTFVLAALLTPMDFGLVAMALTYVLLLQVLVQQGMVPALVHRRSLQGRDLDTAFWLVLGVSLLLTAVSCAFAPVFAAMVGLPSLGPILWALSVVLPIQGLAVVQEAILRRRMDFRSLALRANAAALCGGGVGVALALTGAGVWALVGQQVATAGTGLIALWFVSSWRPRRRWSAQSARELVRYTSLSSLSSVGVFLGRNVDSILIGVMLSPVVVGLYRLAARLLETVLEVTVRSLQAVALPELSRHQDDQQALGERLQALYRGSALLCMPALAMLAVSGPSLVQVIGQEWAPASSLLLLLCVYGIFYVPLIFTGPLLQAVGRTGTLASLMWAGVLVNTCGLVVVAFLVREQPTSAQLLYLGVMRLALQATFHAALHLWQVKRTSGLTMQRVLIALLPGLGGFLATGAAGAVALRLVDGLSPVITMVVSAVASGVVAAVWIAAMDASLRARWRSQIVRLSPFRASASPADQDIGPAADALRVSPPRQR